MKRLHFIFLISLMSAWCGCSKRAHYTIGVSQCSNDGWRQKVNKEIRIGQYQHGDIEVSIVSANNDGRRQARQIDSLVDCRVDLLVVAPSDISTVTPAVDRAYRKGIPVILYDRKTNSPNYTAYIGSDNVEVGRIVGQFIATNLKGRGVVLEVTGAGGSSPVAERHNGFMKAMEHYPAIRVITVQGDWTTEKAEQLTGALMDQGERIDCVFGHNDREAYGGSRAAARRGKHLMTVGIDGLPGPNEGIEFVRKGLLTGTFIYPTKGEEIVNLAMKILRGQPYKRINNLESAIVTRDNAEIVAMQNKEIEAQGANLENIYRRIDGYVQRAQAQKIINMLVLAVILLLLLLLVNFYRISKIKDKANRKIRELSDYRLSFFTAVSHELRTPLTLIADPVNQILERNTLKGEDRQLLLMAARNTGVLNSLVNDIMDVRKTEEGRMQLRLSEFDLADVLRQLADAFRPSMEKKRIAFRMETAAERDYTMVADSDKLQRVVANLLSNAVKYTPAGGHVSLSVSQPEAGRLAVTVTDDGVGMDAEDAEQVFGKYYQAKNSTGGTGIGLALVRLFTELHHGRVTVSSAVGKGSSFRVELPARQEGALIEAPARSQPATLSVSPATTADTARENKFEHIVATEGEERPVVLVVDDNADMRAYIKMTLAGSYQLLFASDGKNGLAIARENIPDLVVSDVMMPVMNGLRFCSLLKSNKATSHIPVVLLTARSRDEQRIEGYEQGADAYITKPFTSRLLQARIANLLQNRAQLRSVFAARSDDGQPLAARLGGRDKEFIDEFRRVIQDNMANPHLKIEELGDKVGLGRVQLYRKVKALTGHTPVDLLRTARLEKGRELLCTTNKTISEIAYSVGFATPSYFTTCFRQQYGMYPNEMRQDG